MADRQCTCGFILPDGAVYCPGCGRPLTAEAREHERTRNALPQKEDLDKPAPVGFSDSHSLRACYWPAVMAALLANLPALNLLSFIWHPGAGFLAVRSYRRGAGRDPTVQEGARLGLMTGVVSFTLTMILLALGSVLPASGGLMERLQRMQEELERNGDAAAAQQLALLIEDPVARAVALVLLLVVSFVFTTGFAAIGGALGARALAHKD